MSNDWIDEYGYRANVGIIVADNAGKLLLGGRVSNKGWQFPQGGMLLGEDPLVAMYRELREEIGLEKDDVNLLGVTQDWIRYQLPDKYIRRASASATSVGAAAGRAGMQLNQVHAAPSHRRDA